MFNFVKFLFKNDQTRKMRVFYTFLSLINKQTIAYPQSQILMKDQLISFKKIIFSAKLVMENLLRSSKKKNDLHLLGFFKRPPTI